MTSSAIVQNPYRAQRRKRPADEISYSHTMANAVFRNARSDLQLFSSYSPRSFSQREVQMATLFNVEKYTLVMNKVETLLADIGHNCAVCYYVDGNHNQHPLHKCPLMQKKCFSCMGDCKKKCSNRPHVPKGQCYYCMLPHFSPRHEPYHNDYGVSGECTMLGKDRIVPLAWLYWNEFKVALSEKYGADQVGSREKFAKWMCLVNDGGILNVLDIIAEIH